MGTTNIFPGILTFLTVIFTIGKIWGPLQSWSWWLVLLPMYGGIVFAIFILLIVMIIGACAS